jgi:DNA-dependent protein kinase catalytic subunit
MLIVPLLGHRSKSVQGPAAELLADALRMGSAGNPRGIAWDVSPGSMCYRIMHQVHGFSKGSKAADSEKFVYSLYKLCSGGKVDKGQFNGAPLVAEFFHAMVIQVLPKLRGDFLTRGIQVLVYMANHWQVDPKLKNQPEKRQEEALKVLTEIRPWVNNFMRQRHPGVQLSALQLLSVTTRQLCLDDKDVAGAPCRDQIAHWLPTLCQVCSTHKKVKCREVFFSIAIWVWENFSMDDEKETVGSDGGTDALCATRTNLRRVLIHGLADEAEVVRALLYSFWNQENRLVDSINRMPQLLAKVYIPDVEERWTGVACSLLLQTCEEGSRWNEKPWEHLGLGGGQRDVDVQKWSSASNPLTTPLYSSSQSLLPTGMVEATQDMSVDLSQTFARRDQSQTMSELAEATVMQVVDRDKTISSQYKRDRDGFKMPAPKGVIEDNMAAGYVRFQKRRGQGGNTFVVRAEKKRKREATLVQSERSTKRVRMLRKYREGERPDFSGLRYKDIFDPLRDLALKDRLFSRLLMDVLFAATTNRQYVANVFSTGGHGNKNEHAQAYTKDVVSGLCGMLLNTNGSPTVVSWLLGAFERLTWKELSTNTQGLTLNQIVSRIGQLSLQSCCYHGGIKALEALELSAQYEQGKRRKGSGRGGGATLATHASGTMAPGSATNSSLASAASAQLLEDRHEIHSQLGNIYRALGDEDTAITIWRHGVASSSESSSATSIMTEALALEISQKYADAQAKYTEAIDAGADARMCDDGLYACAARLQQWDGVAEDAGRQLRQSLETPQEQLSRYDCSERLDRFFKGYTKTSLDSRINIQFLQDRHISDCLDTIHPLSSAVLSLYDGDRSKAEVSVDAYYTRFVTEWSTYHKLASNVRLTKLRGLQRAVEMEETMGCVAVLNRLDATGARERINSLLTGWGSRQPHQSADTDIWADLLTDRQTNLRAVERRILERQSTSGSDRGWNGVIEDIREAEENWCREIANLAAHRAEGHLCNRHRNALSQRPGSGAKLIVATLFVREEQRTDRPHNEALAKYSKGLSAMNKRFSEQDLDYMESQGKAHLLKAELCASMTKTIYRIRDDENDRRWVDGVEWAPDCSRTHSDPDWQVNEACEAFKTAEEMLPREAAQADINHLRFTYANFCRESLPHASNKDSLANTMVQQLLQAMTGGSEAARMNFPSILTVLSEHPSTCATFAAHAPNVPIWMFLMWCRQIISKVNQVRPESDVLIDVLVRLAKAYPQTVFYPFQLSYSDFDKQAKKKAQPLREVFEKLPAIMVLQKFVRGVGLLTDPWGRVLGWYDEIDTAIGQGDARRCKKIVKEMQKDLFPEDKRPLGKLNRQFAQCKFGESFAELSAVVGRIRAWGDRATGRDGNETIRILAPGGKQALQQDKVALENLAKLWKKQNVERVKMVENYSSFIHKELSLLSTDQAIELPGLWDGLTRPDLSQRVTIEGCDAKMMPLESIRAPKKVVFYGSDDKEYPFLAKGGEDLRLDERLEQLFVVMNAQLRQDPEARARQLFIRTFGVTPVSKRAGMLEWCQNTNTLGGVIEEESKAMYARYQELKVASNGNSEILHAEPWTRNWTSFCKAVAPRAHKNDDTNQGPANNLIAKGQVQRIGMGGVFGQKFSDEGWMGRGLSAGYKYLLAENPDMAGDLYRKAQSETPKYLLKTRLLKLAPSPEAYLQLRANCARTWSTANIAGYIAGVGDRHMGNFLLDMTDGSMVGIDFGYSFGVPFMLPIPELTPFRLSPQLLQCFDPLDGKACITQMMTHTMRVLRQVRCQGHMLLSTTHASCNPAMLTATHRQAVECDYSLHHLLHPCIVLRSVCICDCLTRLLCVCPACVSTAHGRAVLCDANLPGRAAHRLAEERTHANEKHEGDYRRRRWRQHSGVAAAAGAHGRGWLRENADASCGPETR